MSRVVSFRRFGLSEKAAIPSHLKDSFLQCCIPETKVTSVHVCMYLSLETLIFRQVCWKSLTFF